MLKPQTVCVKKLDSKISTFNFQNLYLDGGSI